MNNAIIQLNNITKKFDGEIVLDDITLSVKENEFVTFLGPSGCGKTTTLRIIGGFETPDEGEVYFDGKLINDVPGYDKITIDDASRFIATMNYGYAGTRELNEALTSRFMVINMPNISSNNLRKLLQREYPNLREEYVEQFAGLFKDLQLKSENAEISTKSVDLRGLLASINLMDKGLSPFKALQMGITNKSFDDFERTLVEDVIRLRIAENLGRNEIFR
jgi:nitric oxide reductase NorQ protein